MTPDELLALVIKVNNDINGLVYQDVAADDNNDLWIDTWAPNRAWECRDYTIAKAKALREAGAPVNQLSVVLCWIEPEPPPGGGAPVRQYHAVLACSTDGRTLILDNRSPTVYDWQSPPYPYLWAHQQVPGSVNFSDVSRSGLICYDENYPHSTA